MNGISLRGSFLSWLSPFPSHGLSVLLLLAWSSTSRYPTHPHRLYLWVLWLSSYCVSGFCIQLAIDTFCFVIYRLHIIKNKVISSSWYIVDISCMEYHCDLVYNVLILNSFPDGKLSQRNHQLGVSGPERGQWPESYRTHLKSDVDHGKITFGLDRSLMSCRFMSVHVHISGQL